MTKRPTPPKPKDGAAPRRKRRTGYTASRPSSIDKLPDEIRSVIHRLISGGASVTQITDKLVELEQENAPSRSAVGRYVKNQRLITERLNRADVVARAYFRERGEEPVTNIARMNIHLMQTTIFDLFSMIGEDGENGEKALADTLMKNPKAIHDLSKSLDHLTRSARNDLDYEKEVKAFLRAQVVAEAKANIDAAAKKAGLSAETAQALMQGLIKS